MRLRLFLTIGLVFALAAGGLLWRLADHDLDRRNSSAFSVLAAGQQIVGTLWQPEDQIIAVVAFVHGDGPQDRTLSGGYAPMINALLGQGIAVASWDKPGVGASEGNWLHQSMQARTEETRAVLGQLRAQFTDTPIGALGFSQAGWVLPALTRADADFLILVGAAVSWQDQGDYFTRVRLRQAGQDPAEIEAALAAQHITDNRLFGPEAAPEDLPAGMSTDRWRFIRQNRHADARQALAALEIPVLALWGAQDLNVDPDRNAALYRALLAPQNPTSRVMVLPDASHGLLKAPTYNWQLSTDWSPYAIARFLLEGRHAFAPGALDTITDAIRDFAQRP